MAGEEWESAKLESLKVPTDIEVAVNFGMREPPRNLDEVANLLPDNHSTGKMPCFIMESQSTQTRAWRTPPNRLTDNLKHSSWTFNERQILNFRTIQCEKEMKLHDIINQRLKDSTLGIFLYDLNKVQEQCLTIQQDKLDRVLFDIDKKLVNLEILERRNDICDNLFTLIQELLQDNPSGVITNKGTLQQLKVLRLTGSKVTIMDDSLQSLTKLQALVLAGNCLSEVPGHYLPRELLLLELCCNRLQDLSHLLEHCPPYLLYLGLARNYLTQVDTRLSHLAQNLYHLDLAHNDIEELTVAVSACSEFSNLSSLLLIGNPCSMTENYLNYITYKMPKMIFLDGFLIKETYADSKILNGDHMTGTLQITLFRIMSLPQPVPEKIYKKKVLHSYRMEISCPLLKPYVPVRDEFFIEDINFNKELIDEKVPKVKRGSKQKNKGKNENEDISPKRKSSEGKTKEGKPGKRGSQSKKKKVETVVEESTENKEYDAMLKADHSDSQPLFVSDRKPWGKIVEFSDPTIEVTNCDLFTLRNVFRSNVTIRIVHFKTIPPDVKKRKNSNKSKKLNKKRNTLEENNELNEKHTKETLVSKTTVAKLVLPLKDISWNMKSLDFSWNKAKPLKVETALGLKELQYAIKKTKKEPKNKKTTANTSELQTPSELTIHIGVGVKRLQIINCSNDNEDAG